MEQLDRNTMLCVVCDGMGGAKSGNIASSLAMDVFVQEVRRTWTSSMPQEKINQMLHSAAKLANFTVFDQSQQFEEFDGMGTTLVAVLLKNRHATVAHVGDSRAYRVNSEGIWQMTRDHSLVQMMVERGELTQEMARTYPGKNFITRAIGTEATVLSDVFHLELQKGNFLLPMHQTIISTAVTLSGAPRFLAISIRRWQQSERLTPWTTSKRIS